MSEMPRLPTHSVQRSLRLERAVPLSADRVLNPGLAQAVAFESTSPVLVLLAAGKGTRFGSQPKCIQEVAGLPLARHTCEAFRPFSNTPSICIVGYRHEQVSASLGEDLIHVLTSNPAGGTGLAAFEAFCVSGVESADPVLVISMGDRMVPSGTFEQMLQVHCDGQEAELTMLTARYLPPSNRGKGRIVRDADGRIIRIIEQRDIDQLEHGDERAFLDSQTEGNCPLYAIRASLLKRHLGQVSCDNAQQQFYLTDIVESIVREGGTVRSVMTEPGDPAYELLCADVTRPEDVTRLADAHARYRSTVEPSADLASAPLLRLARQIVEGRPAGQVASIANQLQELLQPQDDVPDHWTFDHDQPVAVGISGGRLRIAFMHPDMNRFYGPAWQMPIGAADPCGREQVIVLMQASDDGRIRLLPANPDFREQQNSIAADLACMFPGDDQGESHGYESFGTKMAQQILGSLGYVSDQQLVDLQKRGESLPPPDRWVSSCMRRPFSLLANALASIRTVRDGDLGRRIQASLGRAGFRGLRVVSNGDIPQGGFSSSSAVTIAIQKRSRRALAAGHEKRPDYRPCVPGGVTEPV